MKGRCFGSRGSRRAGCDRGSSLILLLLVLLPFLLASCDDGLFRPPAFDDGFRVVGGVGDVSVALHEDGRFVNLVVGEELYSEWVSKDELDFEDVATFLFFFYATFSDDFDFVVIVFDPDRPRETGVFGRAFGARNDVHGIGIRIHETAERLGSESGELELVTYMRGHGNLRGGPGLHELLHRWSQWVLESEWPAHWGPMGVGGQHGGWVPESLVDLGDGRFEAEGPNGGVWGLVANGGNRLPFAPIELYLMGLIPAEEVPPVLVPIDVVLDPDARAEDPARGFTALRIDTVTVEEIIRRWGPRRPPAREAQTEFRMAHVVVSAEGLSAETGREISEDVRLFVLPASDGDARHYNFWEATGGRATLVADGMERFLRGGALSAEPAERIDPEPRATWDLEPIEEPVDIEVHPWLLAPAEEGR